MTAQRGKAAPVHSQISLQADLGRSDAVLSQLQLKTGDTLRTGSQLTASGSLANYASPQFKFAADGQVDVREVQALTGVAGLEGGVAELHLKGGGTTSKFDVDGRSKLTGVSYRTATVRVSELNASTAIHLTQDDLALSGIDARPREGGTVAGDLRLANWLAPSAPPASKLERSTKPTVPAGPVSRGSVRLQVHGISLRTVLQMTASPKMQDLGFETFVSGRADADWTGNADDFKAVADVGLSAPAQTPADRVPLNGAVDATYYNRSGAVEIRRTRCANPGIAYPCAGRAWRLSAQPAVVDPGRSDDHQSR